MARVEEFGVDLDVHVGLLGHAAAEDFAAFHAHAHEVALGHFDDLLGHAIEVLPQPEVLVDLVEENLVHPIQGDTAADPVEEGTGHGSRAEFTKAIDE